MSNALVYWRRALSLIFDPIEKWTTERSRSRSHTRPIVRGYYRDGMQCYVRGRSVIVQAELHSGPIHRLLYRDHSLRWVETDEPLSESETEEIWRIICADLDNRKVRWMFADQSNRPSQN